MSDGELGIAASRRRRGVIRASVTKLADRIAELEAKMTLSPTDIFKAQQLQKKLEGYDTDFKLYHFKVVDLVEQEELERKQAILEEHDDRVTDYSYRLQQLLCPDERTPKAEPDPRRHLHRRMARVEQNLREVARAVEAIEITPATDRCLLQQYDEQVSYIRMELMDVSRQIASIDDDTSELDDMESTISKAIFRTSLQVRRQLQSLPPTLPKDGIKLPKIDVPTFDGNVMNWRSFWEQYEVAIHSKSQLTDPEKLAYLRQALQNGSARQVIEGLSGTGNNYTEAIDCLRKRYDKPRLLHHAHVRAIIDTPNLKDGNGRELRRLHDTISQHLRALKAMKHEPSGAFITSSIEAKQPCLNGNGTVNTKNMSHILAKT